MVSCQKNICASDFYYKRQKTNNLFYFFHHENIQKISESYFNIHHIQSIIMHVFIYSKTNKNNRGSHLFRQCFHGFFVVLEKKT